MFDTVIRAGAVVDRAIIDKECSIGPDAVIGFGDDDTPNREEPERLNTGITLVGKRATIPRGVRIGRNVKVADGVRAVDFTSRVVKSGGSVVPRRSRPTGLVPVEPAKPLTATAGRGAGNGVPPSIPSTSPRSARGR
jgi:ADP-glucose pyrophosphorylase